jgi:hypothetical protein
MTASNTLLALARLQPPLAEMGVRGLWTVLCEYKGAPLPWEARVVDGRDLLLVDTSCLEYSVADNGMPEALIDVYTVGRHAQHASCLRAWLRAWLDRGFRVLLVLDGSLRPGHDKTFVDRRRGAVRKHAYSSVELREVTAQIEHARDPDDPYEPYGISQKVGYGISQKVGKPPLFNAVFAGVFAELNAEYSGRLSALTPARDADVLLVSLYRRERDQVAALVTSDSDMLVFGVERVLRMQDTELLFDGAPPPPAKLSFNLYGARGTVGKAFLARARAQVLEMKRPETSYQSVGMSGTKALIDTVPEAMLFDLAACLGNDTSKVVREAAANLNVLGHLDSSGDLKASPWRAIRHLLSKVAISREWVGKDGHARQKLFAELKMNAVVGRWKEFCDARDEYTRVPPVDELLELDALGRPDTGVRLQP